MTKNTIGKILNKYCTQSRQGLFLLNMPTGFGKTHNVLEFIHDNYSDFKEQGRKIFFITNLKKNLPLEDLRKRFEKNNLQDDFNQNVLLIDSNVQAVIKTLLLIKDGISEKYTQKEEYKKLINYVEAINKSDLKVIRDDLTSKIMQDLEPAFRRLIEQDLKEKFKTKLERLRAIKEKTEYQWIGKLYPSVFTDERTVLFLSIDKFLLRNVTLIEPSYYFKERLVQDALIFIDEFDGSKEIVLKNIIETGIKDRVDLINSFTSIHNHLHQIKDPKNITDKSKWWQKKASDKNKKWDAPDELIQKLRKNSREIFEKYNLQHICKSDGEEFNKKRNFLFYDYEFLRVIDIDKKLVVDIDSKKNINWIRTFTGNKVQNNSNDIRSLLVEVSSFLTYFQRGISYLSQNYKHLKDENNKEIFSFESAIKTLLNHFNIDNKYIDLLTTKIITGELAYQSPQKNINTLASFYENGFSYYDIIDKEDHDNSSKIQMLEFNRTPESFLIDICSKAMVIGISATASIKSNIANYDIDYLKHSLQNSFVSLEDKEVIALKEAYQQSTEGYKDLSIKTHFIGSKSLEDAQKKLAEILDDKESANGFWNWLENERFDQDNEFIFKRYVKILTAWKYFVYNSDCHGFLCLLNKFPKRKDAELDLDKLHEYFQLFLEGSKDTGLSNNVSEIIFVLSSDDFDSQKERLLKDLANGKRRFIISTYPTIGTGQNLQFKIPENAEIVCTNDWHKNQFMDINAIYLDKPTHLITSLSYSNISQFDFVKHIFQLEFLRESGAISRNEFKNKLNQAFCTFVGEQPKKARKQDYTSLYQTSAYSGFLNKVIIQALGRMCRTNMKSPNIHILADIDIKEHLKNVRLPEDMISIHEYNALVQEASPTTDLSEDELREIENIASEISCRTAKFISKNLEYGNWEDTSIRRWQELRQQVLKQPTVINELQLQRVSQEWRSIYLQLPEPNRFYYYNRDNDHDVQVFFSDKQRSAYKLDEKNVRLSELMKISSFHDLFIENSWATSFPESKYMLTPPMFNDIYKGALGEVCGKCVFEKILNIPLHELDINEFEVFDFKTDNNVYIDFKFWGKNFTRDADEQLDKIRNKIHEIKAEKVLIINILSTENRKFKPRIQKDRSIIEIPHLCINDAIDPQAINFILEELNK